MPPRNEDGSRNRATDLQDPENFDDFQRDFTKKLNDYNELKHQITTMSPSDQLKNTEKLHKLENEVTEMRAAYEPANRDRYHTPFTGPAHMRSVNSAPTSTSTSGQTPREKAIHGSLTTHKKMAR